MKSYGAHNWYTHKISVIEIIPLIYVFSCHTTASQNPCLGSIFKFSFVKSFSEAYSVIQCWSGGPGCAQVCDSWSTDLSSGLHGQPHRTPPEKLHLQLQDSDKFHTCILIFLHDISTWLRPVQLSVSKLNSLCPVQSNSLRTGWAALSHSPTCQGPEPTRCPDSPHRVLNHWILHFSESCLLSSILFANMAKLLTLFHGNYKNCFLTGLPHTVFYFLMFSLSSYWRDSPKILTLKP